MAGKAKVHQLCSSHIHLTVKFTCQWNISSLDMCLCIFC